MKYTQEIDIQKPIHEVIALFDHEENLFKWMEGLQSIEPLGGTPGHRGAKSRMKFKMGKREIEMVETIVVKNLPNELTATYEADGVFNIITNRFVKVTPNSTKYISENEFHFKGFMKIIGFLMPGAFKKQSIKYLMDFKRFVENR